MSETSIKHASNGKRLGAFCIDAGLSFFLGLVLFLFLGEKVIMEQGHYFDNVSDAILMLSRSGLAEAGPSKYTEGQYSSVSYHLPGTNTKYNAINEDGSFGYKSYEDDLVYFFTSFAPKANEFGYKIADVEKYNMSYFNKEWLGLKLVSDEEGRYGNPYYQPGTDDSGKLSLEVRPVLLPSIASMLEVDSTKEDCAKNLYDLYYKNNSADCLYYKAVLLVVESESYQQYYKDANNTLLLAETPSFLLPPLVFFIVIPLLMKDGETLGKKILRLSLLSKDESPVKKWQVALRGLVFVLLPGAFLLPLNAQMIMMIVFLFAAVDMMTLMSNKNGQAIEDKIAGTIVIDSTLSTWDCAANNEASKSEEPSTKKEDVVEVEVKDKEENKAE